MYNKKLILPLLALCVGLPLHAQEEDKVDLTPKVHGTIRGKYEYQTEEGDGRFQVRNARVSLEGNVAKAVEYKAEIDLSDEGQIKMLDAYTKIKPVRGLDFTIGQMRVPFTIDAHRSPHQQYFANRSFIAKQVGNVRDVGATVGYSFNVGIPIILQAGMFNGSGLTNQKDFWTNNINFSAKAQIFIPHGFNITLSTQKIRPDHIAVMMYDAGAYYHAHRWHVEAEYLFKHYEDNAFKNVHAFEAFVNYDIPLRKCFFTKISPLLRYDYMSDHSDGMRYLDGEENTEGSLIINDYQRSRITGGLTFSIAKPFISDIRLNYEKYFYRSGAIAKPSERDKIVIEVMTRF
ncbi:porin [uncultured Prevotella sp.]|uniref:porin n=1 Tax=uncultured Prevotella sp. TaxID=159272 RepID=UPI0025FE2D78|nr:porin [uncultured Prevotella sp.]